MAKENAALNSVSNHTRIFQLDVLSDKIDGGYDIIVSNPPYIQSDVMKTLDVTRFEPQRALDGGDDGLTFYRVIAKKAYDALEKGGMLALEIGYDQRDSITELLKDFSSVACFKDYGGNDRVIIAKK
jgi:release factor glutamine methyltransferase